jgi:hypothetical protein
MRHELQSHDLSLAREAPNHSQAVFWCLGAPPPLSHEVIALFGESRGRPPLEGDGSEGSGLTQLGLSQGKVR